MNEGKSSTQIVVAIIAGVFLCISALITGLFVGKSKGNQQTDQVNDDLSRLASQYDELEQKYQSALDEKSSQNANANIAPQAPTASTAPQTPSVQYLVDVAPPHDVAFSNCYSKIEKSDKYFFKQAGSSFEISSTKYYNGIVWDTYAALTIHTLGGQFSRLEGVLGHIDGTSTAESSLQVFYDGVLMHEFSLTFDMIAKPLILDDLSGVTQLKFFVPSKGALSATSYGLADIIIK